MKTTFLLKNKARDSLKKRLWTVSILFVLGALFFSVLDGAIMKVAEPFWKSQNILAMGVKNTISLFKTKSSLVKENQKLKAEISDYESLLTSLRSVVTRDEALMASLGRPIRQQEVVASVLVHPPLTPYDILIIDAGQNSGLKVGDGVHLLDGGVLGVITETFSRSSRVRLISSSGERTNAVLERHQVPVVLVGQGGGNFKIALQRDVAVEVGDRITSPGIESRLVAIVEDVSMKPTDAFKEVLARSSANIFSIRLVVVER